MRELSRCQACHPGAMCLRHHSAMIAKLDAGLHPTSPRTLSLGRVRCAILVLGAVALAFVWGMYQYIDPGQAVSMQLLDSAGREQLRADANGVHIKGQRQNAMSTEQRAGRVAADNGQSTFYAVPHYGLTLVIILCVFWMLRMLSRQQRALERVQRSQRENQQLIAQLENEHERSSRAASTDHLSGLYNRRQFLEVASRVLIEQRNKRRLLTVLFIDLDRFKSINDTLGHRIGDLLLQAVAGRIRRLLGPGDHAARFGGDEFLVLLAGDRTEQEIVNWVDTLTQRLSATYQLEGSEVNTSSSIGIAICPRDTQDVDTLIRYADVAMYSAKRAGRGQYRFFDQSLNVIDVEEFRLEQAFAEALKQHQFELHYQPQIELDSMSIIGYEALVRWQHPEYGLIYPDRFIPIAEHSGFIISLGQEVVALACQQLAAWVAQDTVARLAVNVSALQLNQPQFSDMVLKQIQDHGLEPWRLELEITETAIFEQEQIAIANLERLREAGLTISLDYFGKGYAGFAHLNALPVNKLKIDRSLIAELSNSHDDSLIVSSTITLAKRLSMQVVAEGVETPEQLVYLRLASCDVVQGYHFSRPLRVEQVTDFQQQFRLKSRVSA